MIKVKTFLPNPNNLWRAERFDTVINSFLEENNVEVIDIKYNTAITNAGGVLCSAMLIYKTKE